MNDQILIITATAVVIFYLFITSRMRRVAERKRIMALDLAYELKNDSRAPDELKSFLSEKDYVGTAGIGAWLISLTTIPVFLVAARADKSSLLSAVGNAGDEILDKFERYLDASIMSSLLRSPLATALMYIQLGVLFVFYIAGHGTLIGASQAIAVLYSKFFVEFKELDETRGLRLLFGR